MNKPLSLEGIIDWHTQQRRLMIAGSMALGEALLKAKFHDEAIKVLQTMALEISELRGQQQVDPTTTPK